MMFFSSTFNKLYCFHAFEEIDNRNDDNAVAVTIELAKVISAAIQGEIVNVSLEIL